MNRQYTKIQLSQKDNWENVKITNHKYRSWILKIIVFLTEIGYLVKLLSNHQATLTPEKLKNISNFREFWRPSLVRSMVYRYLRQWTSCPKVISSPVLSLLFSHQFEKKLMCVFFFPQKKLRGLLWLVNYCHKGFVIAVFNF